MFIKAYASGGQGRAGVQRNVNNATGVNRRMNPQTRYYLRTGTSGLGGNARTRGRQATITPVRGR